MIRGKQFIYIVVLAVAFLLTLYFVPMQVPVQTPEIPGTVATSTSATTPPQEVGGTVRAVVPPLSQRPERCALAVAALPIPNVGNPEDGAPLSYTLSVQNVGALTCINTSISAYYGDSETFVSASPAPTSSNYYWNIGSLKSGAEFTIRVTTQYKEGADAEQKHDACATADNGTDSCVDTPLGDAVTGTFAARTTATTPPKTGEYGVWIWEKQTEITNTDRARLVNQAAAAGFNAVYITLDDYLDIYSLPSGVAKEQKIKAYSESLDSFIGLARAKGIAVDAEAGWRDWAEGDNRAKAYAIVDFVLQYNKTHTNSFRALQYDVEPYLLPDYETNKAAILKNFLGLVDDTLARIQNSNLRLSVAIPHFYDSRQAWTPSISYGGITGHPFTILLKILDRKPGSMVLVMAYRNFTDGADGTIAIADTEVREASLGSGSTNIIVAQETGDVDPGYVTFYGRSKSELYGALGTITNTFKDQKNFGGTAVHYLDTFLDLK